jgi:hypothetical protein
VTVEDSEKRARLDEITHILRALHKMLVDLVKHDYERQQQRQVAGPVELFNLLTQDPFFLWLHPMSALMAEIDELYDQKEPISDEALAGVRDTLEALIGHQGEPPPDSFVARYLKILQDEPEVVMQHAKLRHALDRLH